MSPGSSSDTRPNPGLGSDLSLRSIFDIASLLKNPNLTPKQDLIDETTRTRYRYWCSRSNWLRTVIPHRLRRHAGEDQPVILQLLDITPALEALDGVKMELDDCAFPLLAGVVCTDDPSVGFKDADYALLVGARPRGPGMERKDLLEANAAIFSVQGKAIDEHASKNIKVLVVGNPANTNALITQRNAPSIDPRTLPP